MKKLLKVMRSIKYLKLFEEYIFLLSIIAQLFNFALILVKMNAKIATIHREKYKRPPISVLLYSCFNIYSVISDFNN
jgi:hypothetical protein